MRKRCSSCGEEKPITEFNRNRAMRDGYQNQCRSCNKASATKARKRNPQVYRDAERRRFLRTTYGITADQYDEMLTAQGGVCAICGCTCSSGRRLAVDHNHSTGAVRALLCGDCNVTLGKMKESPALLRAAAAYLELHNGTHPNN